MFIVNKALRNNRICRSLTGLNISKFNNLALQFERLYFEDAHNRTQNRKRKFGGGRKALLLEVKQKLFFILLYIKVYPTFDVLSFISNLDRSECCRWVHRLTPILEKTLGRQCVLPERQINSPEEFFQSFPGLKDIFVDGTERKVQRPGSYRKQKKTFSGKKKTHTRKNIVINDDKKKILYLSPTKSGRKHDKNLSSKMGLSKTPKTVAIWVDLGFQGLQKEHPNVIIPHKKPKGGSLTDEQKKENALISGIRVKSEHAISGIKRMNSTIHPYRNRKINFDDKLIFLSTGIWNFHLAA